MEKRGEKTRLTQEFEGGSSLYLSLYIILLTFFIALVSVSSFHIEKTRKAVESILDVFSLSSRPLSNELSDMSQSGQILAIARQIFADIGACFQSEIPAAQIVEPVPGRLLEVTLPASEFFHKDEDTPRPIRKRLMDSVIAALAYGQDAGIPRRMTITLFTGDASSAPYAQERSLEHRRAVAMGVFAHQRGASPGNVEIGLAPGPLGQVLFTFRIDFENPLERAAPE